MIVIQILLIIIAFGTLTVGAFNRRQPHPIKVIGLMTLMIALLFENIPNGGIYFLLGLALMLTPELCVRIKELFIKPKKRRRKRSQNQY